MNKTIEQLRKTGYKVRVIHKRNYDMAHSFSTGTSLRLSSKGGTTRIDVTTPDNVTVTGEARCSVLDSFDRKLGNKIALGRALSQLFTI